MSLASEQTSFASLSTFATTFSALSALWGAYCVLFIMAIWATFQREGPAQKRLRLITVSLFFVLLTHYLARAVTFGRTRREGQPTSSQEIWTKEAKWSVPLMFTNDITSTIAGTISDGLLAWRFYVVWGRSRWALYVPVVAVCINTSTFLP
ncbi:hypothetical protein PHLGIDRAFT_245763 [Phlebiopsis gigantea 11061_1 CR5-6]|uniref:Uncharacterized protein n=1 Tax=Phlebiopsis gigantea (strain 11061_1 CR5-6) TaxID=745531 RepID=A0A0C3S514_PHLG1|nr:hypothetical protein PHLGIDRAFT_245763 [Phlebiopsis gigantea 11061_1 CR5-6]